MAGKPAPPSWKSFTHGSDSFLGPREPIPLADPAWGCDFEAEIAAIVDDVDQGTAADQAGATIRLLMLVNDVSLRGLIPGELAKGFGFFQAKPSSAFSPVAVTPDELGSHWDGGKVALPLLSFLNGRPFGRPEAAVYSERWPRKNELLHLPIHNTKPSIGGINHVMGSHGHLDFEAFVC